MLDQTLTQLLNELYSLTSSVQQAAQRIAELEERIRDLEEPDVKDTPDYGPEPSPDPI